MQGVHNEIIVAFIVVFSGDLVLFLVEKFLLTKVPASNLLSVTVLVPAVLAGNLLTLDMLATPMLANKVFVSNVFAVRDLATTVLA